MTAADLPYVKGHGTGNDFVVLPDLEGELSLSPELVRALCDRRKGIGADGVLRVVRTVHAEEVGVVAQADRAEWFMDYRNADGSAAEMCGNGIRVFVRYLLDAGLADRPVVSVATRAGVVSVTVEHDGLFAAELGPAALPEIRPPARVSVDVVGWPAVAVTMPNPHAVVFVRDLAEAGDLLRGPTAAPAEAFPDGANVEFVVLGPESATLSMRVWERGVGETASCGTGACAAVVAARRRLAPGGVGVPEQWTVSVPGGQLRVTERPDGRVELAGPAVLVSSGTVRMDALAVSA